MNEKGETALHVATIDGNFNRVKQLIDEVCCRRHGIVVIKCLINYYLLRALMSILKITVAGLHYTKPVTTVTRVC